MMTSKDAASEKAENVTYKSDNSVPNSMMASGGDYHSALETSMSASYVSGLTSLYHCLRVISTSTADAITVTGNFYMELG